METKRYFVKSIEGEYAYLTDADNPSEEPLFIAMALLPMGVDVGSELMYEDFEFKFANSNI